MKIYISGGCKNDKYLHAQSVCCPNGERESVFSEWVIRCFEGMLNSEEKTLLL